MATQPTTPPPAGDTPAPRSHEETWGANPAAKEKYAAAKKTETAEKK